jgi:hypothetical protein
MTKPSTHVSPDVVIVDDDESVRSLVACCVEQLACRSISISMGRSNEAPALADPNFDEWSSQTH